MNLNVTKNAMRGLTVFISDLRNAQSKENEEKRVTKEMAHIRKEFKENKGIDGYQRRKYVCKLLYTYMLGYDLDFGHMEAVTLISSNKFQEKSIGYIALGMLLHENHEMIPLLINSLQEDLQARNDFFQCLALSGIGNIGGKEMAESLAPLVQKLLVASTSAPHIKKRAALALLRMFRKYPSLITPDLWADKLITILDDPDLGVLTALMSLFLGLVSENPDGWDVAVPKIVTLLGKIVITREYTKEYVYYSIPNPWLQTKLLRFLRHYGPPSSTPVASRLTEILNVIFAAADAAKAGTVNHKNALNAVLFEAINLVIHYDNDQNLLRQTGVLLGRFISAKETNIRYLGLEAMSHLASLSTETATMVKKFQETVIGALKDADISIRRRALDLLYGMCDKHSSKAIVAELLSYLVTADYAIREELVLKIANLAEKFASNYSWYVDVILQLISLAGDFVSDDIWHRVIKIVTNHEDIQEYAARTVFKALQSPTCHETTVKVGGYILGEFGHLIAEQKESPPQAQLSVLHTKFPTCGLATRAMLLSTYAKFVNLFPDLLRQLQDIFNQHRSFIDMEIQQRACEYYNLSSLNDEELLQTVLDIIPAWNEKDDSGQTQNNNQEGQLIEAEQPSGGVNEGKSKGQRTRSASRNAISPVDDLLGLNLGSPGGGGGGNSSASGSPNRLAPSPTPGSDLSDPFGLNAGALVTTPAISTNNNGGAGYGIGGGGAGFGNATTAGGNNAAATGGFFGGANTSNSGFGGGNAATGGFFGGGNAAQGGTNTAAGGFGLGGGATGGQGLLDFGPSSPYGGANPTSTTNNSSPTTITTSNNNSFSSTSTSPPLALTSGSTTTTSPLGGLPSNDSSDPLQAKINAMFKRLCLVSEGVLYEDGTLQIGMKTEYQREMGRIMFYYGNSSMNSLTNFTTAILPSPNLQIQAQPVVSTIAPKAQVQQLVTLICTGDILDPPILQISFVNVRPVNISLRLPVVVSKFTEPLKLAAPDFFGQWKNFGNKPQEAQEVFKVGRAIDLNWMSKVTGEGCHFSVLKGVDPSINNIVAAGTYYAASGTSIALVRLETNPQANMCRLTVRSPNNTLSNAVKALLSSQLS